jgi:hypothetical protein
MSKTRRGRPRCEPAARADELHDLCRARRRDRSWHGRSLRRIPAAAPLGTSIASVNSALQRAAATSRSSSLANPELEPAHSRAGRQHVERAAARPRTAEMLAVTAAPQRPFRNIEARDGPHERPCPRRMYGPQGDPRPEATPPGRACTGQAGTSRRSRPSATTDTGTRSVVTPVPGTVPSPADAARSAIASGRESVHRMRRAVSGRRGRTGPLPAGRLSVPGQPGMRRALTPARLRRPDRHETDAARARCDRKRTPPGLAANRSSADAGSPRARLPRTGPPRSFLRGRSHGATTMRLR